MAEKKREEDEDDRALKQREQRNATRPEVNRKGRRRRRRGGGDEREKVRTKRVEGEGRVSHDRARCNARAALYKQHVGRRSPRSSQGHPGNVPMPPMQDKFSHSTESGDELVPPRRGAEISRARARDNRESERGS